MKPASASSALKVQDVLGDAFQVLEFEASTRTAMDAAAAIGCSVDQIAKSLIFRAKSSDRSVLVMMRGAHRADEKLIAQELGEKIGRADADFVRERTGFAIGGVPPVGHAMDPVVLIDDGLNGFDKIWAAAGTPNAVFELSPSDLVRLTTGEFCPIARSID